MQSDNTDKRSRTNAYQPVLPKPSPVCDAIVEHWDDRLFDQPTVSPQNPKPIKLCAIGILCSALGACDSNIPAASDVPADNPPELKQISNSSNAPEDAGNGIPSRAAIFRIGSDNSTNREKLPSALREPNAVRYTSGQPIMLPRLLAKLSDLSGIAHVLLVGPEGIPIPATKTEGISGLMVKAGIGEPIQADFGGALPDILDQVSKQFGLAWRYEQGTIILRQFIADRYQLAALPSRTEFSASVGKTNTTGGIDWSSEIQSAVEVIAKPNAIVTYGEGSGILSVVAKPDAQRRVAEYVQQLNEFLTAQVTFDVNVLSIAQNQTQKVGIDFDFVADAGANGLVRWESQPYSASGAGTINVGIVQGDLDLGLLISALDRRGEVTVETRTGATTSNNQIVPIQVVNETAFAQRIEAVARTDGSVGTTIEPGTLTTGFELQLLPRILPNGTILLRYTIKLSDLNELSEFTSDRQTIQLPKLSTTTFEQQALLGDNQTLVLMGFERNREVFDRPGSGIMAKFFGSRSGSEKQKSSTILTIRPRILRDMTSASSFSN